MQTEKLAADTLLERGVTMQLPAPLLWRLFGKKKITLTAKRPTMATLLRISSLYMGMGLSADRLKSLTVDEGFVLFVRHEKTIREIVAVVICTRRRWLTRIIAGYLKHAQPKELYTMFYTVLMFSGLSHFTNTIKLASATRMTEPMNLSRKSQGS